VKGLTVEGEAARGESRGKRRHRMRAGLPRQGQITFMYV